MMTATKLPCLLVVLVGLCLAQVLVHGELATSKSKASSSTALFAKALADAKEACSVPRSLFCTNVHWKVSDKIIADMSKSHKEMQIEVLWVNFQGSRQCKQRFRDLQCRYAFPDCVKGPPCRSECEAFAKACPGAMQPCNSFPKANCYTLPKTKSSPAFSARPGLLGLLLAALGLLLLGRVA